ncbi:MAG: mechanosensitive ion channel [Thaumarchaeota archaeon]|nr:mechanosensitive ion channel [Nitrososphaerota archaeon]MDE1872478.1 mechanosensitive ion channel [Nitrososphaerota archaeon]
MPVSTDSSPDDILKTEQRFSKTHRKTLRSEFYTLAIKFILISVGSWISLHLFELFVAPSIGVTHIHIQIVSVIAIAIIAFAVITATRRLLKEFASKTHPQFSASLTFFIIIFITLVASLAILDQLNVNPQEILISGGVAAIILGIGVSTIVGNILSGGLMLTTYPAKIGDSVHVVNDNVRGKIGEINMFYTKIQTDEGKEYIIPNNAIIQGNVRILKDIPIAEQLPYSEGDVIEISGPLEKYIGTVIRVTSKFTTILNDERTKEYILANNMILQGNFTIVKHRTKS